MIFLIFLKRKIWNATFREYSIKTLYCWSPTTQNMRICYLYHHVCINIVRLLLINTPWITGPGTRHALLIWLVPCQYQVDKCEVAVGITQTSQRHVWIYIVQRFLSGVYLDLVSLTFILFLFILLHFIFRCFFLKVTLINFLFQNKVILWQSYHSLNVKTKKNIFSL